MQIYQSINPFTEELIAAFQLSSNDEIKQALAQAKKAQKNWAELPFKERSICLVQLADLLKKEATRLAEIASKEMGKTLEHAKAEILKSATVCHYYAQHAETILATEKQSIENNLSIERTYKPMGIVLGIYPWNFPFWQIIRSAIPAVMGGNAVLIKPAPNVPMSSLALQLLFDKAGFPTGILQTLFASNEQISELIKNPSVAAVTLTGSNKAGSEVAALAGKAIKPIVLELGGSDPFIICEDAQLNDIIDHAIFSRFQNNGQSCVSAKRFIIHESLVAEFESLLIQKLKLLNYGDPLNATTDIGPLARKDLKENLALQVKKSLLLGAQIVYQHKEIPVNGFFYPTTVLKAIPKNAPAYTEELFGPVLSIYPYKNIEQAIELANDTIYGLGCSIWTKNIENGKYLADQIECGMVYINQLVKSDVRFPFGGCKQSGFGKELGPEGLKAFCVLKTRWINA
jgi:succinate-semialdehyde dehydrogenase/glutarate-semialdehyde dehydrogenase